MTSGVKPSTTGALLEVETRQQTKSVKLSDLMRPADNKINLARQYIALV